MKKLFAIILSAMLILTMCTVTAFAIDQNVALEEVDGRLEITEAGTYILTGTLDGTVYVDPGEGDVELILDGADINGGDQPGIIAESGNSLTINLPDGSINRIGGNAGNLYSATIYSTIDTTFVGDGALYVISDTANGIATENADLTFEGGSYAIAMVDEIILRASARKLQHEPIRSADERGYAEWSAASDERQYAERSAASDER